MALVILDRGSVTTIAGLRSVTFTLYVHRRTTCRVSNGTRRACTKTIRKAVRARHTADGQYVLQLSGLRGAERPRLRAIATDAAGNRSTYTVTLKLRRGR